MDKVLVTGAGGFMGHHMTTLLKHQGYWVRGWILCWPIRHTIRDILSEIADVQRSALRSTVGPIGAGALPV